MHYIVSGSPKPWHVRVLDPNLVEGWLTMKMEAPLSFEMSGTTLPMTQCHILENLNPHHHLCENLVSQLSLHSKYIFKSVSRVPIVSCLMLSKRNVFMWHRVQDIPTQTPQKIQCLIQNAQLYFVHKMI
jgi:hypothetical protein